jgi:hypothetical protein
MSQQKHKSDLLDIFWHFLWLPSVVPATPKEPKATAPAVKGGAPTLATSACLDNDR